MTTRRGGQVARATSSAAAVDEDESQGRRPEGTARQEEVQGHAADERPRHAALEAQHHGHGDAHGEDEVGLDAAHLELGQHARLEDGGEEGPHGRSQDAHRVCR